MPEEARQATARPGDALGSLRARRRSRRLAGIAWLDAFYQAYVTALLSGLAVLLVSGWIGDRHVGPTGVEELMQDGPAALGLVTALVLAVGLRSGSRGGPVALEAADVQHVLLAPVPRRTALWNPMLHQLRFLVFVAAAAGLVGGQLAARRLPGNPVAWVAVTVAWAVLVVGGGVGAAWLAAGHRLRPSLATLTGAVLVTWSVADLADMAPGAPTTFVGALALWPVRFDPAALVGVAGLLVVATLGLLSYSRLSVELAQRRSLLVGQIRFAATMRDLRTVMVLRRQLAQEGPRHRPWFGTLRRGPARTHVLHRDWRAAARTPAARLIRLAGLGVVAGLAARGVWAGTTPLIVVAGLAAYLAGLDAIEPLAAEIDNPHVLELAPVEAGSVLARHLVVPALTMLGVGVVGFVAAVAPEPSTQGLAVTGITAVTAALAATAGAAISIVRSGSPDDAELSMVVPPEVTGMRTIVQLVLPPAVATIGFAPVLGAAKAMDRGVDPLRGASSMLVPALVAAAAVAAWVRWREPLHEWWRTSMEQAGARGGRP